MRKLTFKFPTVALKDAESLNFRTPLVRYSYKKLICISRHLTRYPLNDVMAMLLFMNKKPAPILLKALKTFKNNVMLKEKLTTEDDIDFSRFIVKSITVEKKIRLHSIRYHAKSYFARTDSNFCRLKFEFHILNI